MSKIFFTSDLHFGHKNILKYCARPFDDVEAMDAYLIKQWNSVVERGDRVYVLGDISLSYLPDRAASILKSLNGQKFLIAGNHDKRPRTSSDFQECFVWIKDYATLKVDKQKIVMSHYPMLTWDGKQYGSWMLHGHCHGSLDEDLNALRMDVGVDSHGGTPISFERLQAHFERGTRVSPWVMPGDFLTWDELADEYEAANGGRRARTLEMAVIMSWALKQTDKFQSSEGGFIYRIKPKVAET